MAKWIIKGPERPIILKIIPLSPPTHSLSLSRPMAAYSPKKKKKNSCHLYSLFHHSDHDHFHRAIPSTDDHLFVMELEESDVVWGQDDEPSDASSSSSRHRACSGVTAPALTSSRKKKKKKKPKEAAVSASLPVNVPDWSRARRLGGIVEEEEEGDEEGDAVVTAERLPPHEYLARRRGDSFSVREGIGRTLKGMELCRVRNEILKKLVGFED